MRRMMPGGRPQLNGPSRAARHFVSALRRTLLTLLPKVALSRVTGLLTDIPVPRPLRRAYYGWFSRRYGVNLDEVGVDLRRFRSLSRFFGRELRPDARPIAPGAALVWPCDGKIVTSGPVEQGQIPQVKGQDYPLAELLIDAELATRLAEGSQATIYLAPGDYHRVHIPIDGQRLRHWHVPGGLFPVNPAAVRAIPDLFTRNERVVFELRLADGRAAAMVMVAALNVGNIEVRFPTSGPVSRGDEAGAFGFGSTVVVIVEKGEPAFASLPPETVVRMGQDGTGATDPTGILG